ncbi:UNVERIFIED_CONTAM: hypothetical protein NCL1_23926 [Trichonephila clavipes]
MDTSNKEVTITRKNDKCINCLIQITINKSNSKLIALYIINYNISEYRNMYITLPIRNYSNIEIKFFSFIINISNYNIIF